jgi:hypothetical protein
MFEEFLSVKDLARTMAISTRSVMRWSHRLHFPPSRAGNACNRWSHDDAVAFIYAWQHWDHPKETGSDYFARVRLDQSTDPALQRSFAAWLLTDDQLAGPKKNGSLRRRQTVNA